MHDVIKFGLGYREVGEGKNIIKIYMYKKWQFFSNHGPAFGRSTYYCDCINNEKDIVINTK